METVIVNNKTYIRIAKDEKDCCAGCAGEHITHLCCDLPECEQVIFVEKPIMTDKINSPSHYTSGGIEAIDYIQAKLGDDGCIAYCLGNVIKYVSRAGKKDISAETEDLKKAQWYLNKVISISTETQNDY